MPTSSILFDPSLVLGMIIEPEKIEQLEAIAAAQWPADMARDKFNALLRHKLILDMTMRELISLGASPDQLKDLQTTITKLTDDVISAASDLATAEMSSTAAIATLSSEQGQKQISMQLQSPIDFAASKLRVAGTAKLAEPRTRFPQLHFAPRD